MEREGEWMVKQKGPNSNLTTSESPWKHTEILCSISATSVYLELLQRWFFEKKDEKSVVQNSQLRAVCQVLVSLTLFRTIQKLLDRKKALGGPERGTRCHSQTKQQLTLTSGFLCQAQLRASYRSWTDLILTTSPWADAVMTPCFARQGNKSLVLKNIYMISHESQIWLQSFVEVLWSDWTGSNQVLEP